MIEEQFLQNPNLFLKYLEKIYQEGVMRSRLSEHAMPNMQTLEPIKEVLGVSLMQGTRQEEPLPRSGMSAKARIMQAQIFNQSMKSRKQGNLGQ